METKLYEIYESAIDFMLSDGDCVDAKNIIEQAAALYAEGDVADELKGVFEKCINHVNMDGDNTLAEHIAHGEELVEELCGCLGSYFE